MLSSSSTVLVSPLLSIKFNTSSTTLPRIRLHHHRPPLVTAAAATTTTASSTWTQERNSTSTSTYLRPQRMASRAASLYEILGIPVGATDGEIKSAYRRLARTCHPDVATYDRKDTSAGEFIKIHAAYCTLSDPGKRAVYDQNLFRRRRPLTSASGFSGYSGRSWETDQCW